MIPSHDENQLLLAAHQAQANAHAPYSLFKVGAAILSDDGKIYNGCNVENAAYPSGTCAEENAIGSMIAAGSKRIKAILVLGQNQTGLVPCGACRQRIAEFADEQTLVLCAGTSGITHRLMLTQLLPYAFGRDTLNPDRGNSHG